MSKEFDKYFEINKATWNQKVDVHVESEFYALEAFMKGESSLKQYELDDIGDASGKSLLHLQCHFGQDTLSWSRMGLDAQFICCNVLDTSEFVKDQFDIVYTSYGVIGWLPDLKPWAKMIAERLKPGGIFYMVEFHPIVWMFDYLGTKPEMKYGYHQKEVIYEEYQGTYADENANVISKEYGWNHGLGEIVSSLSEAGLSIHYLKEYDESPYEIFPGLIQKEKGMFVTEHKLYPLVFTIKATK